MLRRFLADADLNVAIIAGAIRRNPELDFKRAAEVPLDGLADEVVLELAAGDGRILVSHDVNTMPGHFRTFVGERVRA
jgi:Domain of unknown function (DUF5615)